MRRSGKQRLLPWDPSGLALALLAGSLVALLGWGVEQRRLSDREVPAHTALLPAYP